MKIDANFSGTIVKDQVEGGWTYIVWKESAAALGTRRATKVLASIEGIDFETTCMPSGDGTHMVPLRSKVMELIRKSVGDEVAVRIRNKEQK